MIRYQVLMISTSDNDSKVSNETGTISNGDNNNRNTIGK